jgi:murein L,D-transpeptidase YafK
MKRISITAGVIAMFAAFFVVFVSTPMAQQQLANPRIVVHKAARTLKLYDARKLVKTYKMVLGFSPEGDKQVEGDGRTPEGEFYVFVKNDKSSFTVSLGVSYPSIDDANRGAEKRLITEAEEHEIRTAIKNRTMPPQKTKLGGEIYIHGGGTERDWTDGCIALADNDIVELFSHAKTGMSVTILP